MDVTLYDMSCDPYVVDKSSYLTNYLTIKNVYFKEGNHDLMYPSLILKMPEDFSTFHYNYVMLDMRPGVDDLTKYYFITRWIILDTNRLQIDLREDVLYTFKDKITASDAYIKRSESDGRIDLYDDKMTFEYKPFSNVIVYDGYPVTMKNTCIEYATTPYIMVVFLNDDPNGGNIGTSEVPSGFSPIILNNNYKENGLDCMKSYRILPYNMLRVLLRQVYNDPTLPTYIIGIYTFPFDIEVVTTPPATFSGKYPVGPMATSIRLGNTSITVDNYQPTYFLHKFPIYNRDTPFTDNEFYKYEPNLKYSWWIDYLGWKEIPYKNLYKCELLIYYDINLETGDANVVVESDGNVVSIDQVNLCTKIPISTTNAVEATNQRNANFQSTTISAITSALTFSGGAIALNPLVMAGGAMGFGSAVVSGINRNTQIYDRANAIASSSNVAVSLPKLTKLECYKLDGQNPIPINASRMGLPLNEYRTLGNITGYTEAIDFRFYDATGILDNELNEIKRLLLEGVIL